MLWRERMGTLLRQRMLVLAVPRGRHLGFRQERLVLWMGWSMLHVRVLLDVQHHHDDTAVRDALPVEEREEAGAQLLLRFLHGLVVRLL